MNLNERSMFTSEQREPISASCIVSPGWKFADCLQLLPDQPVNYSMYDFLPNHLRLTQEEYAKQSISSQTSLISDSQSFEQLSTSGKYSTDFDLKPQSSSIAQIAQELANSTPASQRENDYSMKSPFPYLLKNKHKKQASVKESGLSSMASQTVYRRSATAASLSEIPRNMSASSFWKSPNQKMSRTNSLIDWNQNNNSNSSISMLKYQDHSLMQSTSTSFSQIPLRQTKAPNRTRSTSIVAKIDSNLERKHYVKHNNKSSLQNKAYKQDSIASQLIVQNYLVEKMTQPLAYSNEPISNLYVNLLIETEDSHQRFTEHISTTISQEDQLLKNRLNSEVIGLVDVVERQNNRIQQLLKQIDIMTKKCGDLSTLVAQYREQIVRMNNYDVMVSKTVKKLQDDISSVDLLFQFEDPYCSYAQSYSFEDGMAESLGKISTYVSNLKNKIIFGKAEREEQLQIFVRKLQTSVLKNNSNNKVNQPQMQEPLEILRLTIDNVIGKWTQIQSQNEQYIKSLQEAKALDKVYYEGEIDRIVKQYERLLRKTRKIDGIGDNQDTCNSNQKKKLKNQMNEWLYNGNVESKCQSEEKKAIRNLLSVLDWLERCVEVSAEGELKVDMSLVQDIESDELQKWCQKYRDNLKLSIAQHIRRQVDKRVQFNTNNTVQMKRFIYSEDYESYFDQLVVLLIRREIKSLRSSRVASSSSDMFNEA